MKKFYLSYFLVILLFSLYLIICCIEEKGNRGVVAEIIHKEIALDKGKEITSIEEEDAMNSDVKRVQNLQKEMVEFWIAHQEEMESFALKLKNLDISNTERTYLYSVEENALYYFVVGHHKSQGIIVDHPILTETAFFGQDPVFEWVAWDDNWFEQDACTFTKSLYDEDSGRPYAELTLFYSEKDPVTDKYRHIEKLDLNWFLYCEYRE